MCISPNDQMLKHRDGTAVSWYSATTCQPTKPKIERKHTMYYIEISYKCTTDIITFQALILSEILVESGKRERTSGTDTHCLTGMKRVRSSNKKKAIQYLEVHVVLDYRPSKETAYYRIPRADPYKIKRSSSLMHLISSHLSHTHLYTQTSAPKFPRTFYFPLHTPAQRPLILPFDIQSLTRSVMRTTSS